MDQELVRNIASNGIFAAMFVFLGMRFMKMADQDREFIREVLPKLTALIDKVTERMEGK